MRKTHSYYLYIYCMHDIIVFKTLHQHIAHNVGGTTHALEWQMCLNMGMFLENVTIFGNTRKSSHKYLWAE